MIPSVNRFVDSPLNDSDEVCTYCLDTDAGVKNSQIYSRTPENLRDRFVQHLRGDRVCQKVHAACMRAAAQIGAAHNLQRPLQCSSCTQTVTHVNDVPLAQYLGLERLPGPVEEEQVEGLAEAAREELPGFVRSLEYYTVLRDACKAMIYANNNEELVQLFVIISGLVRNNPPIETLFSRLQALEGAELEIGIRAALEQSLKLGNIPLLQALLRDEGISRSISLKMRGEAIAEIFKYKNYANSNEQQERWRYMAESLLPVAGGRIPEACLKRAVLAAVHNNAVDILERLLRHGAISESTRGDALYAAVVWTSPEQQRMIQILLADGEIPSESLKRALIFAVSQDVGIIRELLRYPNISKECKRAALERAIVLHKREVIRLISQDFSFQERMSAIWFAVGKAVQPEIYKDLSDLKIRTIFMTAAGLSIPYLWRAYWSKNG